MRVQTRGNSNMKTTTRRLSLLGVAAVLVFLTVKDARAQIFFDITDNGAGGVDVVASGSAVVTPRAPQFFQIGVSTGNFADETFQDFSQNGIQTTINGGPWAFSDAGSGAGGPGINFNGFTLNQLNTSATFFHLLGGGQIPDSDGVTPIAPTGSFTAPGVTFANLPGAPAPGGTTLISLYGADEVIFRLTAPPVAPAMPPIAVAFLAALLAAVAVWLLGRRRDLTAAS